jgi:hypothetical protein
MSEWYERTQGATKACAESNGLPWDASDVETVIAFTDIDTDEDIALALGRTLAAVWNIQHRMRTEGVTALREAYAPRVERDVTTCATHHIALRANGECDWC